MNHLERGRDGRNQFWRYAVVTLVSFVGGQLLGSLPLAALIANASRAGGKSGLELLADPAALGISGNTALVLMLLPFVISLLLLVFMVRWVHKRRPAEIINGTKRVRWSRFFFAAGIWMALQIAVFGLSYALDPGNFSFRFDPSTFIPLLIVSLLLVPLQTSYEELFMRGYLAQGIGAATRNRWAAILIPGIAFGLLHLMNPEVEAYGVAIMLPQYILIGLVFGLASTLDDGIETAMGAHAANNICACVLVTFRSSALRTDALFEMHEVRPELDLVTLVLMSAAFLLLLRRRYGWRFATLGRRVGE